MNPRKEKALRQLSRRGFLTALGALAASPALATLTLSGKSAPADGALSPTLAPPPASPSVQPAFKLSVLTDEITQDFARALEVASREFGLSYVDLRQLWGKNIIELDDRHVAQAKTLLLRYGLKVGCIAGPLFKSRFPGAPKSRFAPKNDNSSDSSMLAVQEKVLERTIEMARLFECDAIRCFDFWRLEDPKPFREAMDEKLRETARRAAGHKLRLLLENEHACNTATAAESVRTLQAVAEKNFQLIWDPGNAFFAGENPYPDGYRLLPKERIGMLHLKDATRKGTENPKFAAMGQGQIDYVGQFRALKQDGFTGLLTLETHWKGAGSLEESSRQSMAGIRELLKQAGAL